MDKELLVIKVVRKVISMISTGVYRPGRKLPAERILCQQLGVSRGTLRQGLADLDSLGVVKIVPRSGIYIKKYSDKKLPKKVLPPNFRDVNLRDIINARKIIEIPALELACENAKKSEIKVLKSLISKMEGAVDDLPEFLRNDTKFHQAVVAASKNLVLVTAFESISEYLKYSQVYTSVHEGEEDKALKFHKKIFNAIKNRQKKYGVRVLERHLDEILENTETGKDIK
ncbi:MAG: FadR/GntR family transcriptional regulator [Phycisphaerae bacterium]|jgi:GntR family transcriptional repressor for pyruvate dehydrogenase complex